MERLLSRLPSIPAMACAFTIWLLLLAGPAHATDVPALQGPVNDYAHVLGDDAAVIGARLAADEQRTGNQVVVLTVRSLGGQDIESYANDVFAQWKLGQKGKDNGVLMVVAVDDHRMRIEVGYGLEGTLTDLASSRIIRERMQPRFADGDYAGGVESGVDGVLGVLDGEAAASPAPADESPAQVIAREGFWKSGAGIFVVLVALFWLLFTWMASQGGSWWSMFLLGPLTIPLLLLLFPWWGVACVYALHLCLATLWRRRQMRGEFRLGKKTKYRTTVRQWPPSLADILLWTGPRKGGLTGYGGGGRGGSGGSGSGSSSSGYSGGGGSSGGGGASGSW
ncbi:TPM domain-containing protein [Dyella telluris]|uniref:TPM domain-containing protein n=1 Tax=Dyella telluris TaxID=2763498 RepID=A0A7G8Q0Z8_9GAMM|nr:TPM domain-containing protein [Dyella telluris]QNK00456.1 TPM domain-containing protein [Dyella telluris]